MNSPLRWHLAKLLAFSAFPGIPLLAPLGYYAAMPWLSPLVIFVGIPLLDLMIRKDRSGPFVNRTPSAVVGWLYLIPGVYILAWVSTLSWAVLVLRTDSIPPATTAWLILSVGISSAFATCVAHELLHWPEAFARAGARLVMATVCYGHFPIEHLHHHAAVGIAHEGTTPPLGQSVWAFLACNAAFTFRSAWRIERRRQIGKAIPLIQNRFFQQWLLTGVMVIAFTIFGGALGLLLFTVQAAFGIYTTEYINYAQHYGLIRDADAPLSGRLSWSSNTFATNAATLNITRHAHHHLRDGIRYYDLEHIEAMPMLPAGYLALFFPAMIPAVWRSLMDARARVFADEGVESSSSAGPADKPFNVRAIFMQDSERLS